MKKVFLLLAVTVMLWGMAGAEGFVLPEEPVFADGYGLREYYASLEARWGAFHAWPLEAKAWLHAAAEELDLAQLAWLEANGYAADASEWHWPTEIVDRAHGMPAGESVSFAEVEALARRTLG